MVCSGIIWISHTHAHTHQFNSYFLALPELASNQTRDIESSCQWWNFRSVNFVCVCSCNCSFLCFCQPLTTGATLFLDCACMCLSMHDDMLNVRYCDILQTARGNFTKFTALVQLRTKMNRLHFEVKRSYIKVTVRPNALSWWRHTMDSLPS